MCSKLQNKYRYKAAMKICKSVDRQLPHCLSNKYDMTPLSYQKVSQIFNDQDIHKPHEHI